MDEGHSPPNGSEAAISAMTQDDGSDPRPILASAADHVNRQNGLN